MESSRKQTTNYQNKIIKQLDALPDEKPLFSPFEDEMIRKYYPSKGGPAIARILGKPISQLKSRVQSLKVKRL
jgi:hypothetical protein